MVSAFFPKSSETLKESEVAPSSGVRWKCICAYDGGAFSGWQSQISRTGVQDRLEARLAILFKRPIRVHGSGRTDSGVHARAQAFHFDAVWKATPEKLLLAMNNGLPRELRVTSAREVNTDFHARHSAMGREYRYQILTRPPDPFEYRYWWFLNRNLNEQTIREAIPLLLGTHDFLAFSARGEDQEKTIKTLREIELLREGDHWILRFEGSGFLYKMVRSLVGALAYVGMHRLAPVRLAELFEERKRTEEIFTAPAHGLFLQKVTYPEPFNHDPS